MSDFQKEDGFQKEMQNELMVDDIFGILVEDPTAAKNDTLNLHIEVKDQWKN